MKSTRVAPNPLAARPIRSPRRFDPPLPVADTSVVPRDPTRSAALTFGLIFIFFRVSFLHEVFTYLVGQNTYILYLFGPIALLLMIFSGGLLRTFSYKQARWWLGFIVWLVLSTLFSTWRSDSLVTTVNYLRTEMPVLFLTAGLIVTAGELRRCMSVIALAGLCNVVTGRLYMAQDAEGRIGLSFGSMANANDFAAHLMMVLPFVVFAAIRPNSSRVVRLLALPTVGYGLFLVLKSGSRGALLALVCVFLVILLFGSARAKMAVFVGAPIAAAVFVAVLPGAVAERLGSAFGGSNQPGEAAESKAKRIYLLEQSVRITVQNPLFGVGPDQFANSQGRDQRAKGIKGVWQVSHNSYTQISSEMGIPGLFFFLGGIASTFLAALRVHRKLSARTDLKSRPDLAELKAAAFALLLSVTGFGASLFFLSLAYRFHILLLAGCAAALTGVATRAPGPEPAAQNLPLANTRRLVRAPGLRA